MGVYEISETDGTVNLGPLRDDRNPTFGEIDGQVVVYDSLLWSCIVDYSANKLTLKPYDIPGVIDRAPDCKGLVREGVFDSYSQYQLDKVDGDLKQLKVSHRFDWNKQSWDFVMVDPLHPHVPICLEHRRVWPCPHHREAHRIDTSLANLEWEANKSFCGKCGKEVNISGGQMSIEISATPGRVAVWFHGRSGPCRTAAYQLAGQLGHTLPDRSEWGCKPRQRYTAKSVPPGSGGGHE